MLLRRFCELTIERGELPTEADLMIKRRGDPTFPSKSTCRRWGGRDALLAKVTEFCEEHGRFAAMRLAPHSLALGNIVSGKRQHFIPRCLQSGFASHQNGGEAFTWVYRKGLQPFNTNIKNVGVEGAFYAEGPEKEVDSIITAFEGRFGVTLRTIRSNMSLNGIDGRTLAELFAHLEIRTRHLRENFLSTSNLVLDELLKFFENTELSAGYLIRKIKNDPSLMRDAMSVELHRHRVPQERLPDMLQAAEPFIDQAMPYLLEQLPVMTKYLRETLPAKIEQAIKSGHINALSRTLAPQVKVERYSELKYDLVSIDGKYMPLGDSVVLFQVNAERRFKSYLDKDDELEAVLLPITPQVVIVGRNREVDIIEEALPYQIASCSLEHFIAFERSSGYEHLSSVIGEKAYLLSEQQIESMVDDFMRE